MKKQVLFIQGGGKAGYEADATLVASLQTALGRSYTIRYPRMQTDETAPDYGWLKQIETEINKCKNEVILIAHSLGASLVLKYLSEHKAPQQVARIFLLATPFWAGTEDWVQGLKLRDDFAQRLPQTSRIFFYHCRDDEEVPVGHLGTYRHKLPGATFHEFDRGGHQFDNHLNLVAKAIKDQ